MALLSENATPRRRLQFRLGTLLSMLTALCVFLAAVHWLDRQAAYGFFFVAGFLGALALTLLPVVVFVLGRGAAAAERLGKLFVAAGCMLLFHLVATALSAESALRPWYLDPNPFDDVIGSTGKPSMLASRSFTASASPSEHSRATS
jgi:hypothetical protein